MCFMIHRTQKWIFKKSGGKSQNFTKPSKGGGGRGVPPLWSNTKLFPVIFFEGFPNAFYRQAICKQILVLGMRGILYHYFNKNHYSWGLREWNFRIQDPEEGFWNWGNLSWVFLKNTFFATLGPVGKLYPNNWVREWHYYQATMLA